ncbi:transglutaminase family protein [Mucilaginibacter limnophilus]|uniref:Transglutaminase family protein n=1 Tax=Mucilaginibacter limnophilus TaxID=1932778 RepID=A0A437MHT5_9SPHI|nr:transglutaminase family protein [Mucilaginibacter limnophilus]RVT97191.1 transglutaminase family protein [Mucilaginibacter limnophilus]
MKFDVYASMLYTANSPGTLILNIHALRTPNQTVVSEMFTLEPYIKAEELVSIHGENRLVRFEVANPGEISIVYTARIDNAYKLVELGDVPETPVHQLPTDVLTYLNPSRYCQSDKLFRLANNMFGNIENPFQKVSTLVDWIYNNVQYLSGSTNSQTSAFDTVTEQAGVCRDFAHLGIALCRALTIPARYFTGYAYKLFPADFHACFEAYIGGEWILFDATRLAPLNSMVKIATGRDAADAAIANIFGDISFNAMQVNCTLADENFVPFYYLPGGTQGISYL